MGEVKLYDTTLRDGAQRDGISYSVGDKIMIAKLLDNLGLDYLEGGWPGSNPKDLDFFYKARKIAFKNIKIAAFGSTRHVGNKVEKDANVRQLLEAETEVVTIFGKSWDFHVTEALQTTLDENLRMIKETVSYLKDRDKEVIYDAEHFFDGYRHNPDYALATVKAAAEGGADTIVLCDTNGGLLPLELQEIFSLVKKSIAVPLGIHAHNDAGMGVANSILAFQAGATHIQGTINGYGERCGNADLCTIIPNIQYKLGCQVLEESKLNELTKISRTVAELANMIPLDSQPYVGSNAFTHKGGIHVDAVIKHPETYEHFNPELVGNKRRILVSELAGKSNILYKANELDIELTKQYPATRKVLETIKRMEYEGYQFEAAEGSFELLLLKTMKVYRPLFTLEGFRVINEKYKNNDGEIISEATVKLKVKNQLVHTVAEGNGPVNALDQALRKALEGIYPALKKIKLVDYKVRVLEGRAGTAAKVRVLIFTRDDKKCWGTVGVSTNIIEASWLSLVDSIEYGLLCRQGKSLEELREAVKKLSEKEKNGYLGDTAS